MMNTNKPNGPSILLVEDTPSQALRFKINLEENGCQVTWTKTGQGGLDVAYHNDFDMIILDIELPDINGFEVCRKLKAKSGVADIPVVMLTTRDRAEDAMVGLSNGAIDYIPKDPFSEMVLLETMRQMGLMA
jgi:DNA-binding response OmpR family regulator